MHTNDRIIKNGEIGGGCLLGTLRYVHVHPNMYVRSARVWDVSVFTTEVKVDNGQCWHSFMGVQHLWGGLMWLVAGEPCCCLWSDLRPCVGHVVPEGLLLWVILWTLNK